MNNLKTLTALAAVMLAGLAAPMATAAPAPADCAAAEPLLRPLTGSTTDSFTIGDGEKKAYYLPAWQSGDDVFLQSGPVSGLTMFIVKVACGVDEATDGDHSYTWASGDNPHLYVVIENPLGGVGSVTATIERTL